MVEHAVPPAPAVDTRARRPYYGAAAILAAAAALVTVGFPVTITALLGEAPYVQLHLGYPGAHVAIITTLLCACAQLATLVVCGALTQLLFFRDTPARSALRLTPGFEIPVLRGGAAVWAVSAAGLALFEAFDSSGTPFTQLATPGVLRYLWQASYAPTAWAISFLAALLVFFLSFFVERWTGLLIPLWATLLAVLAPIVSGQVLVGPNHDVGGDAAVLRTVAMNLCFGAVVVAALRLLSGRRLSQVALRRLCWVCSVALPLIISMDAILAVFTLAGSSPFASLSGWLIVAGAGCAVAVAGIFVAAVMIARRGQMPAATLTVLCVLAAAAIAARMGLEVAMTRQPPPQYFVPTSIEQVFMGFEVPDAPTWGVLFSQWRPNLLFLGIAAAAIVVYLLALRTLHLRGDAWPRGRTVAWVAGWAIVVAATSSGFGKYSAANFGVHMIVHMSLNMLAPGLLVLGGVVTLLLRATRSDRTQAAGVHDWIIWVLHWKVLRLLYNPLLVFMAFVGSYYGLYLTSIFGEFMRFHWAHQLMNVHFLVIGYLYYSLSIGVDRPPRPLPHIGKLGYVLAAMPFHAFFGVILMTSPVIIAETFYQYLDLPWADLSAQQYLGGGVAWAGGEIPLLIVIIALGVQWSRQDAKDARRKDRHFDLGRDDEYDVYNQMLERLAERETERAKLRQSISEKDRS